jgi:16S rRNA processing protein RimM
LAIDTANGEVLVPFVKQIVPEVNVELGRVTLTPPEGLFEVNLEGSAQDEN